MLASQIGDFVVIIVVPGALLITWCILVVRSDLRYKIRRGKVDPADGPFTATAQVALAIEGLSRARQVGTRALRQVGAHHLSDPDERHSVGWTGMGWTNIPGVISYQLVVEYQCPPEGGVLFVCQARLRNPLTLLGRNVSQELVDRLAQAISATTPRASGGVSVDSP